MVGGGRRDMCSLRRCRSARGAPWRKALWQLVNGRHTYVKMDDAGMMLRFTRWPVNATFVGKQ